MADRGTNNLPMRYQNGGVLKGMYTLRGFHEMLCGLREATKKSSSASGPTTKRGWGGVVKAGPLRKKIFFEALITKGLSGRTSSGGLF